MCGIFGLIRNPLAANPDRATAAFVELGRLAVERGRDSAGFALINPAIMQGTHTNVSKIDVDRRDHTIDGIRIIKDTVPFEDLWDDEAHLPLLADARVAIGHTRWATQGKRGELVNASPLAVGSLVGTHNGDVATRSIPGHWTLQKDTHGGTDTEVLYRALNRDRRDRRLITSILKSVEGRAALAWLDRTRPDRVYLARAGLSPLAIAWDAEGNLYWASNPRWFRDADVLLGGVVDFTEIILVPEGRLFSIDLADGKPEVSDVRKFTPKVRASDARLSDTVVWRGFVKADVDVDKAQICHTIVKAPAKSWSHTGSGKTGSAAAFSSATVTRGSGTLPDYNDRLSGLGGYSWDRDQHTLFGHDGDVVDVEDVWGEEETILMEDEVDEAVLDWAEQGCPEAVLQRIEAATTTADQNRLCSEWGLSTARALTRFAEELHMWIDEGWTNQIATSNAD